MVKELDSYKVVLGPVNIHLDYIAEGTCIETADFEVSTYSHITFFEVSSVMAASRVRSLSITGQ